MMIYDVNIFAGVTADVFGLINLTWPRVTWQHDARPCSHSVVGEGCEEWVYHDPADNVGGSNWFRVGSLHEGQGQV